MTRRSAQKSRRSGRAHRSSKRNLSNPLRLRTHRLHEFTDNPTRSSQPTSLDWLLYTTKALSACHRRLAEPVPTCQLLLLPAPLPALSLSLLCLPSQLLLLLLLLSPLPLLSLLMLSSLLLLLAPSLMQALSLALAPLLSPAGTISSTVVGNYLGMTAATLTATALALALATLLATATARQQRQPASLVAPAVKIFAGPEATCTRRPCVWRRPLFDLAPLF